ncbi:MAG: hypothetical protein J5719_05990, partial [Bacteroidales bacterium]|nr:hypothetical protein [Bacteroidales bacterium]
MRKLFFAVTFMIMCLGAMSQNITLTFTGRDGNNRFIPLNRVEITNVTQNWSETIYYPDTILMLGSTGIDEFGSEKEFALSQNVPNPFDGTTDFLLNMPHNGRVLLEVYDLNGKKITEYKNSLPSGTHTFKVILSTSQSYMLTARSGANRASIKMVNNGHAGENAIRYLGAGRMLPLSMQLKDGTKGQTDKPFAIGDQMKYVGYALINGEECKSSTIEHSLLGSETITLIFDIASSEDDGKPCKGLATITDVDCNTYNTVQIGEQCWMKENLRTTKYADGRSIEQGYESSSDVAYWYYPNNSSSNKATYGLLYNWKAVMRNSSSSSANPSGVQGICPTGWHVPSDAEWTQLTDYVREQPQYRCICDFGIISISKALASKNGWKYSQQCAPGWNPQSNNATGFSAVPAGYCQGEYYDDIGISAIFWGAGEDSLNAKRGHSFVCNHGGAWIDGYAYAKVDGVSVRCLRGEGNAPNMPNVTTLTISDISTTSAICGGNITSDGSDAVTSRGVCWSTTKEPTINNSKTTDGMGTGSYTSNLTGLTSGTTYYVRAYATNSVGTAYGEERTFTTTATTQDGLPCPGATTLTDCDGNTYNTVQIGEQCWMKENLRVTRYTDGTAIVKGDDHYEKTVIAAWHFMSSIDLSATNGIEANKGVAKVSNSMGSAVNFIGSSSSICCS